MPNRIKIPLLVLTALILFASVSVAEEGKVRVVVERARIYAEASTDSYRIETIKRGTVLTLFGAKQADENWYYVYYQSSRWGSKVTGFIQRTMVEELTEEAEGGVEPERQLAEEQKEEPVKVKEEKPEDVQPETKVEPVRVERVIEITAVAAHPALPFPLTFAVGQDPRVFQRITEEEMARGILPGRTEQTVEPVDNVKTKVWEEKVVVPEKTEVPEKEREIPRIDEVEKEERLPEKVPQVVTQKPSRPLFTFSLGYGPSLGGLGGFIQMNATGSLSVHWGFGYYPTSLFYPDYDWVKGKALYSFGVKYYLPLRSSQIRPYLDLQYGGISVEAVRVISGIWYYTYIYEDLQKTLWGPSILAGVELRFGTFGLNGAVGASYVATKWEYWDQPLFVTADLSILFYF